MDWTKIIEHIDHAVKIAGVDHVGLGSDFDGANMPYGMEDATKLPKITEALLQKGYSESDMKKILGRKYSAGNGGGRARSRKELNAKK